jgi:Tfp pilus assembly protein PilX
MKMNHKFIQDQRGGVSIFLVIFSALLVTIVTVSFVGLMIRSQQQASNADLSNSAYDAALAGVEDAKRLLLIYRDCQRTGDTTSPQCQKAVPAINDATRPCNTVKKGLYGTADTDEVLIQRQQSGDNVSAELDRAYTCVKIGYLSPDIQGTLSDGQTKLVPLETSGPYDKIKISWFKRKSTSSNPLGTVPTSTTDTFLFPAKTSAEWPDTAAPVLRSQFVQTGSSFSSSSFDPTVDSTSNTNTVFLYPQRYDNPLTRSDSLSFFGNDTTPKSPTGVICSAYDYAQGSYACEATITVPPVVGGGARAASFLILEPLYNAADYKIELLDTSGNAVQVVAPVVDSTGRANDLFRRVSARIDFASDYPIAEMSLQGNLCKNFAVTDNQYIAGAPACDP